MAKKGVIDFQSYLLKLKAEKIIDDIANLSAKEKLILKDAFEMGKNLNKTNPELADDLEQAIVEQKWHKYVTQDFSTQSLAFYQEPLNFEFKS